MKKKRISSGTGTWVSFDQLDLHVMYQPSAAARALLAPTTGRVCDLLERLQLREVVVGIRGGEAQRMHRRPHLCHRRRERGSFGSWLPYGCQPSACQWPWDGRWLECKIQGQ